MRIDKNKSLKKSKILGGKYMGKQIINRLKKTLAILLMIFFVVSLTAVATSAQPTPLGCPRGYHPADPTGPDGLSICVPDSSTPSYSDGYAKGKGQAIIDGFRNGETRGEIDARKNKPYKLATKPPTVTPYNSEPLYVGVADGYRDAYVEAYNNGYKRGYKRGLKKGIDCTDYNLGYANGYKAGYNYGKNLKDCGGLLRFTMSFFKPCSSTHYAGYETGHSKGYEAGYSDGISANNLKC